jgi:Ca2+/H+ antiporter, TMEM165/GDT1 family
MKKFWIRKGLMFITLFIVLTLVVGLVVMGLWNAILPAVLGIKAITFVQALGILLLSKILFGGFHGGFKGRKDQWRMKMQQKMGNMTPEEREKFKAEWRNRCGTRWNMNRQEAKDVAE